MPIYEYKCSKCGRRFEKLIMGLHQSEGVRCDACGSGEVRRLISSFSASSTKAGSSGGGGSSCGPATGGFS
jgi:putative FmdB family regulatory protein